MNKRELMLELAAGRAPAGYTPAAFFLHFGPEYHVGQAAIDRHLQFFRHTGMDFVKIQYEQGMSTHPIASPADWARAPRLTAEDFAPTLNVVRGLVEVAGRDALVILTLYSPFMWARHLAGEAVLHEHLREHPAQAAKGLEISTENVLTLVRAAKQAGVDGFYASTQGGEAFRFGGSDIFERLVKPTDLAVWDELAACRFNILHVCDYEGAYDSLAPFLDYPGHIVNCSLEVGDRHMTPREAAALFGRPFMGGLERKGILATGAPADVRRAAQAVLADAPERFVLAADCTVPGDTSWDNLAAAIAVAHGN
ncbi:MAG: methylcobalamin:coenzyme M methyltransferase [Chloroflexi bacterium ADurb.Bin325]|nr:MAG: methylcobalamin:coenzyme M methyltransferase [Chloroflexi bacterium ADurb.Bin325]